MSVNVFSRSEKMPHPCHCVMLRPWNVDREAMCLCILHVHDYDYDNEITLFEHKQNQHIHIIIVQ